MKAVIFDMDGVVSDTDYLHGEILSLQLKNNNVDITSIALHKRFAGMKTIQVYETLVKEHSLKGNARELLDEKNILFKKRLDKELRPITGAIELIQQLNANNIPLALASGSEYKIINWTIDGLDLRKYFQNILSSDDVEHGKPAPDIFLKVATSIGIAPEDCVVIEDGMSGMIAAKAAGMKCVALVKIDDDRQFPADLIIYDLRELNLERLREL